MELIIQKATINDLKYIQELNLQLFKKEYREYDPLLNLNWTFGQNGVDYFKKRIFGRNSCMFIASVRGKIIGYLCGSLTKKKSYRMPILTADLENIFVLEKYRSNGTGQGLYQEFQKWCFLKKVKKIYVNAYFKNKRAIKFYKTNKFKECLLNLEVNL